MRVMAAVMAFVAGEAMNVQQVCREAGISRQTFYKYVARCRAEAVDGFEHVPAGRTVPAGDARRGRRRGGRGGASSSSEAGLDHGATTIQWHLGRDEAFTATGAVGGDGASDLGPSRVRRRRQPEKRPKSSWQRFEASAPNEWWQIDSMDWVIAAAGRGQDLQHHR